MDLIDVSPMKHFGNGYWFIIETPDYIMANANILYAIIIGIFFVIIIENLLKK
ncbi:MAG: hypothetical protein ACTSPH_12280 [Promethearchaeota archaeon]